MTEVFALLTNLFYTFVNYMKEIPISDNVSLYDFSIAIFIMTITVVAFVPLVRVGSSNISSRSRGSERSKSSNDE